MKKRILAACGVLLAVLLVLAGCGSRAANDSPGGAGYGSYNQKAKATRPPKRCLIPKALCRVPGSRRKAKTAVQR